MSVRKNRPIFLLDGQWIRPKHLRLDMDRVEFPSYIGDTVWWEQRTQEQRAVDLSYVKYDGVAHAVQVYTTIHEVRPSGRELISFSIQPTSDETSLFTVKRTLTQEEYEAMRSEIDEMEWSV